MLSRTPRGTIDIEASLQALGITDPGVLRQRRFKPGTVGTALKCVLGARGHRPGRLAQDQDSPDLYTYPAEELPLLPGTGKIDLAACLEMFGIQDPAVLWKKRFRPNSAGGRLKMCLRANGFAPTAASPPIEPPREEDATFSLQSEMCGSLPTNANLSAIQRDAQGKIDIQASLKAVGIGDPKLLWRRPIEPGSPEHLLKKEIARVLAKREAVPGVTRQDIGLSI